MKDKDGQPKYIKIINIYQVPNVWSCWNNSTNNRSRWRDELLSSKPTDCKLPTRQWLSEGQNIFKALMRDHNTIAKMALGISQRQLQPSGSFRSCYRLEDPSRSFVGSLRYLASTTGHALGTPRFLSMQRRSLITANQDLEIIALLQHTETRAKSTKRCDFPRLDN